jgi:putative inorganic carbon (hco3(-)) transporter
MHGVTDAPAAVDGRPAPTASSRLPGEGLLVAATALLGVQLHGVSNFDVAPSDLLLVAYVCFRAWSIPLPSPSQRRGLLCFIVGCGSSAAIALLFDQSLPAGWLWTRLLGIGIAVLYFLAWAEFATRRGAKRLLKPFVLGVLVVNAALVLPVVRGVLSSVFVQLEPDRLSGGMYDHNSNGSLLAVALLLVIFSQLDLAGSVRRYGLIGALSLLFFLTYSRGAFVAVAVGALVAVLVLGRTRRVLSPRTVVAGMGGLAAAFVAGIPQRLAGHFAGRPDTLATRVEYLDYAVTTFSAHPFTGAGFGAAARDLGINIHATLFSLLAEAGLLAAIGFVIFVGSALLRSGRGVLAGHPQAAGLLAAHVAMLVISLSIEALFQRHWWLVLACIAALPGVTSSCASFTSPSPRTAELLATSAS